jgi:hypothetical protein
MYFPPINLDQPYNLKKNRRWIRDRLLIFRIRVCLGFKVRGFLRFKVAHNRGQFNIVSNDLFFKAFFAYNIIYNNILGNLSTLNTNVYLEVLLMHNINSTSLNLHLNFIYRISLNMAFNLIYIYIYIYLL